MAPSQDYNMLAVLLCVYVKVKSLNQLVAHKTSVPHT